MKNFELTLAQQLRVTDYEIVERKRLLNFSPDDEKVLGECGNLVRRNIDSLVDEFYRQQLSHPAIAQIIGDQTTLSRLANAQRNYILDLFSGSYDLAYVNNRLRIGMVHKRIGVEPKYYMSAMLVLRNMLANLFRQHLQDDIHRRVIMLSLDKLLNFDSTLVFDTYLHSMLEAVQSERARVQLYAESLEQKVIERTRQLEHESTHDALTGLYNRRASVDMLRGELARGQRRGTSVALLFFDVDRFKKINDQEGHAAGDRALQFISTSIANVCREGDVAFRYGGDEFCILLPDTDCEGAMSFSARLHEELAMSGRNLTISIGIACTGPHNYCDPEALILKADQMMYRSKKAGSGLTHMCHDGDDEGVCCAVPGSSIDGTAAA